MGSDQAITVCHLASGDLWAGAEIQASIMCRYLARRDDVNVRAILLNHGRLEDELKAAGIDCAVYDEATLNFSEILRSVEKDLKARPVAILHSHRYKENVIGALLKRKCGIRRLVETVHGRPEPFRGIAGLRSAVYGLFKFLARLRFDMLQSVSHDLDRHLARHISKKRRCVIHNAVDLEALTVSRSRQEIRAELGIPLDAIVLVSAARMVPVKALDQLIEAAEPVLAEYPNVWLLLAGDGPLFESVKAVARQSKQSDRIVMPGFRNDITDVLKASDVLVLSSLHEGIPTVLLEAMALELPVVTTAVGGIPEVVEHDKTALLTPPGDPDALASAISRLLTDTNLRLALVDRAQKRVLQNFTAEVQASRLAMAYEDLAKNT